eukprot:2884610-Rhodomonas_salina.5
MTLGRDEGARKIGAREGSRGKAQGMGRGGVRPEIRYASTGHRTHGEMKYEDALCAYTLYQGRASLHLISRRTCARSCGLIARMTENTRCCSPLHVIPDATSVPQLHRNVGACT